MQRTILSAQTKLDTAQRRACDVVLDPATGQALGLIVCGGCGIFRSEKSQMEIPWRQIACIGDDVILVSPGSC